MYRPVRMASAVLDSIARLRGSSTQIFTSGGMLWNGRVATQGGLGCGSVPLGHETEAHKRSPPKRCVGTAAHLSRPILRTSMTNFRQAIPKPEACVSAAPMSNFSFAVSYG